MSSSQAKDLVFLYVAKRDAEYIKDAILGIPRYEFLRRPTRSNFSTTISREFKQIKNRGVVFLIIARKIVGIGSYTTSRANITNKKRVSIRHVIKITPALDVQQIMSSLEPKHSRHLPATAEDHEVLLPVPDKTKRAVLGFFEEHLPESFGDIQRLYSLSELRDEIPSFKGAEVFQQEKDSLLMSLSLLPGIDFDVQERITYSKAAKKDPFRLLLSGGEIEDDYIYHDASNFGDIGAIRKYSNGSFRYTQPETGAELIVTNCNRKRLEQTLGVDLIIYNEMYKSYLLLQYKRMTKGEPLDPDEFEDDTEVTDEILADSAYGFRPDSDPNFAKELTQMSNVFSGATGNLGSAKIGPSAWRIGPDFLFFKICGSLNKRLVSGNQISGMYLPLAYAKLLLEDEGTKGPRGGRIFTYKNCSSYLNKDSFEDLAKRGLIGSAGLATDRISKYIEMSLSMNKSVVLSEIRSHAKKRAP